MGTSENNGQGLLENVILGEIEGKNAAIHAYDGIIWKIRTGYLTLLYAGWAILLNCIVSSGSGTKTAGQSSQPQAFSDYSDLEIIVAMMVFSVGLAVGGWVVDWIYTRRKARVICGFDDLIRSIHKHPDDLTRINVGLLQIVGDNPDREHRSKGFWEAMRGGWYVFGIPLGTVLAAALIYIL